MRSLGMIISACCIATICSEALGLGILWFRGQLNAGTIKNVRAALSGQDFESPAASEPASEEDVSIEDVVKDRSLRVLEFDSQQHSLIALKSMVDSTKAELLKEKEGFRKLQSEFELRLKQLDAERTSEATQKAQAVLLVMPPADAVSALMQLTLDENVLLLSEMPEKKVAGLLKEFATIEKDAPRIARGKEIFEALSRGEPARKLIRDTAGKLGEPTVPGEPTANLPAPAETPRGN